MTEMNEQLEAKIILQLQESIKTLSAREVCEKLVLQFDKQALFNALSKYMRNSSIGRKEWIACIKVLCSVNKQLANDVFVDLLPKTSDMDKRARILIHLEGCGTPSAVPVLIKMLGEEKEPSLRYLVVNALRGIGDDRAIPALEWTADNDHELNHENIPVSRAARRVIEELNQR